jgi:uncharacterized protein YpiB (UPF0302 family)
MNHYQKEQKNELIIITSTNSESTMFEKEAEMVIDHSLFSFKQKNLMDQIDNTLVNKDEALFIKLSKQYTMLLSQYSYLL